MELRLNKLNLETGEIEEETQEDMVLTAFKTFPDFECTDWELKNKIEQIYSIKIDERNWVAARRSDGLMPKGLVIATEKKRKGEFGINCTVWKLLPDGKKEEKVCLSSNQMARIEKYLHDKCQQANSYQIRRMKSIIEHFEVLNNGKILSNL